ncbi:hypothetical protein U1Q18_039273 [Sarracenia purpurea var. burkii]
MSTMGAFVNLDRDLPAKDCVSLKDRDLPAIAFLRSGDGEKFRISGSDTMHDVGLRSCVISSGLGFSSICRIRALHTRRWIFWKDQTSEVDVLLADADGVFHSIKVGTNVE